MFKQSHRAICVATGLSTLAVLGTFASPALATSANQIVTGTTLPSLSLALGTPAAFTTGFAPNNTANATGTLVATDTDGGWTLSVQDQGTADPGHMTAAALGCTGSDAALQDPLSVTLAPAVTLTGFNSVGPVSISGTTQTVATGSSSQPLAANVLDTNYSQTIPSSQSMIDGCVYSLTSTYTLQ